MIPVSITVETRREQIVVRGESHDDRNERNYSAGVRGAANAAYRPAANAEARPLVFDVANLP